MLAMTFKQEFIAVHAKICMHCFTHSFFLSFFLLLTMEKKLCVGRLTSDFVNGNAQKFDAQSFARKKVVTKRALQYEPKGVLR
jgi:hypothetical protein